VSYSKQTEEKQCFVTNSKELERLSMERGICPIALLALHLTLYSLMFLQQLFVSRRKNLPHSFIVGPIESIKNNWVTSLTPRCQVTIGTTHGPFLLMIC